jgi:hypothetical protein
MKLHARTCLNCLFAKNKLTTAGEGDEAVEIEMRKPLNDISEMTN